ncbi:MAG: hypothetical protein SGILL_010770 [Bacillariaceae sp.]
MDWFDDHWMFLAPPLTFMLLIVKYVILAPQSGEKKDPRLQELLMWGWLSLFMYSFHQFEEHGYDLYGRRYHFIEYLNEMKPLGIVMEKRYITYINVLQVHVFFGLYAWYAEKTGNPLLAVLNNSLSALNALMGHILPAVFKQAYNPGLLQSIFMAPIAIRVIHKYYQYTGKSGMAVVLCVIFGSVYGHVIMLLLPVKLVNMGYFADTGYLLWTTGAAAFYPVFANAVLGSASSDKARVE